MQIAKNGPANQKDGHINMNPMFGFVTRVTMTEWKKTKKTKQEIIKWTINSYSWWMT